MLFNESMRCLKYLSLCLFGFQLSAEKPFHQRVDALMDSSLGKSALAGPADDSEFLRRAYLDFAGRIPSAETVRKFLADQSCGKRTKLIDELFADSLWSEVMADVDISGRKMVIK